MKNNEKKLEENLLELAKQKEEKDKQLLALEWVIGYISSITFITLILIASIIDLQPFIRIVLIVTGSIIFAIGMGNAIKIEQIAGYYKCRKCNHSYIPTYKSVFFAMHMGRTRYMKCPKCNKYSWQKKVISK